MNYDDDDATPKIEQQNLYIFFFSLFLSQTQKIFNWKLTLLTILGAFYFELFLSFYYIHGKN